MWYKNFKRVKTEQDRRFTLLSNGSLLIDPVHESDTGDYICRITQLGKEAGTSLREQRKDIKVVVYGKFVLLVPFRWLWTIHKIARPSDLALQIERELKLSSRGKVRRLKEDKRDRKSGHNNALFSS